MEQPRIEDFDSLPEFLSSWLDHAKRHDSTFSFRNFALRAGLKSHSQIHKVFSGKATIRDEDIDAYIQGLGLTGKNRIQFHRIVSTQQLEKVEMIDRVDRSLPCKLAVASLVFLDDFRPDPEWVHRITKGTVSVAEAKQALESLTENGQIYEDESGTWKVQRITITNSKKTSPAQRGFLPLLRFQTDLHDKSNRNWPSSGHYMINCTPEEAVRLRSEIETVILRFRESHSSGKHVISCLLSMEELTAGQS